MSLFWFNLLPFNSKEIINYRNLNLDGIDRNKLNYNMRYVYFSTHPIIALATNLGSGGNA